MTDAWLGGSSAEDQLQEMSAWADRAAPIGEAEYRTRIEKARRLTEACGADALLVGAGTSLRYFTGLGWGATERFVAWALPVHGDPVFVCPTFEIPTLEASAKVSADVIGWEEHEDPYKALADHAAGQGIKTLAVAPDISFGMTERLRAAAPSVTLTSGAALIDECRSIKSDAELALLRQAKRMTLEVHRRAARIMAPGITATEVRRFIDAAHARLGAAGSSFCIVLFGEATSYPHGVPGELTLTEGDPILIDTGCRVEGYHSDITRSYVYGEPDEDYRRLWALEKAAQIAAFDAAIPGAPAEAADHAARAVLQGGGLGPDYALPGLPHRTGHGVGLDIHEEPYLVRGDDTPLAPGMCFSNEPMIVVPGRYGIRLEDHMHVEKGGAVWFTEPAIAVDAPFG